MIPVVKKNGSAANLIVTRAANPIVMPPSMSLGSIDNRLTFFGNFEIVALYPSRLE